MDTKVIEPCRSLRLHRSSSLITTNATINYNKSLDNLIDNEDESVYCEPFHFLLDFFHQYYIPFIISVGLVGNLLSCIVFLNTHLKMRSSSYYLAALATTDFSFLISLLFVWLNSQIGWRVFNKDGWCEILVYVSAVCSSLSVWLIVAFTVERFIAVQYPLHRPYICTVARAKTIILILVILALGCHSYVFVTAGVIKNRDNEDMCELKPEYLEVMRIINITDTVASLMAPLILIVVMNTMIMRNFLKFSKKFKQAPTMTAVISNQCPSRERSEINLNQIPSGSSSNSGIILGTRRVPSQPSSHSSKNNHSHHSSTTGMAMAVQTTATAVGTTAPPVISSLPGRNGAFSPPEVVTRCIHIRSSSRNLATTRNQQSITKMLLLISTVFVLLNLPSYAIRLCIFFFTLTRRVQPALLWCLQQFFMLLYYTNFSINFLLYAMCGITFRRCLDQLLRKCLKNVTRYLGRRRRNFGELSNRIRNFNRNFFTHI